MNDREREMWRITLDFMKIVDQRLERLECAAFGGEYHLSPNTEALTVVEKPRFDKETTS